MTAQVCEKLIYEDRELSMCEEPLSLWISKNRNKCKFGMISTACWRGYVGTWMVIYKHLYLTELSAQNEHGREISLKDLFPDQQKVFAHWFSGEVRCPEGKLLDYVHMGYASTYERDYFLTFKKGVLVSERIQTNGNGEPNSPEGYGVEAFTLFAPTAKK